MEYFEIQQDKRYLRSPTLENFYEKFSRNDFNIKNSYKISEVNTIFASCEYEQDMLDFLDTQLLLVSKEMKELISIFEPCVRFKLFCILNKIRFEINEYYAPILREIDCLSDKSEFNLNKSKAKKLILNKNKLKDIAIFKLPNLQTDITIVRLDIAESILRRKFKGIILNRLEVN